MLYETGDTLPSLAVVRAEDVRPHDTYWGCQADNPRKGWLLNAEPTPAPEGAMPAGDGSIPELVTIGGYIVRRDDLVLIQVN